MAKKMIYFCIKSMASELPPLLFVQATNIFMVLDLGPTSLAIFSRSIALVRHMVVFMGKFSIILTPSVGSLLGIGQEEEPHLFFLKSTRYGVAFASPIPFFLIFNGDFRSRYGWVNTMYIARYLPFSPWDIYCLQPRV
jgi:hypothetical protein